MMINLAKRELTLCGTLLLSGVGCAATPAPQSAHVDAKTAISAADTAGAQDVPQASLYLKMARDGVQQAEKLIEEEKNEEAAKVLERARKDAELARSLTREAQIRVEAEEELERVRKLEEANRQSVKQNALG